MGSNRGVVRYRTIVADPPWAYPAGFLSQSRSPGKWAKPGVHKDLPYAALSVSELQALPIEDLAAPDCRLFLWTTNRYLPEGFSVMSAWGFRYRQTLVWHKTDGNVPGAVAPISCEFLLVGTRGTPGDPFGRNGDPGLIPFPTSVISTSQPKRHSVKPELFMDYVEASCSAPYLELFARRQRLGWDTWGNEALEHVELGA